MVYIVLLMSICHCPRKMKYFTISNSPIGRILMMSDGENLNALEAIGRRDIASDGLAEKKDLPVFKSANLWLKKYFSGGNPPISSVPIKPLEGTPFQKIVWKILLEIPYGSTITYGEIAREAARRLGKLKMSAQAVGQAVGQNPISIIIPCHRVIGANGNLTGYNGGIDVKIKLLEIEGIDTSRMSHPSKNRRRK